MKILILGNGYLGHKYLQHFAGAAFLSPLRRVDSCRDVIEEIRSHGADAVINCAAKTGRPNIDWCETHKSETLHANVTVPLLISQACRETGARMVHIGTGGIYQGRDCREEDAPNFIESYYSKTKHLAEEALKDFDILQLRVAMPLDGVPHPKNLITKLLAYPETINEVNSITVLEDLMSATQKLLAGRAAGIFNVVNPDPISTTEILDIYNAHAIHKKEIHEIPMTRLQELVKAGRSVCTLSTAKLENAGVRLRKTRPAVMECVREYVRCGEPTLASSPV